MGEGLAIAFDSIEIANVVGTEMQGLAGAVSNFNLSNRDYGFQLSTERLFHINGTPRENYAPKFYVRQNNDKSDDFFLWAFNLLKLND